MSSSSASAEDKENTEQTSVEECASFDPEESSKSQDTGLGN